MSSAQDSKVLLYLVLMTSRTVSHSCDVISTTSQGIALLMTSQLVWDTKCLNPSSNFRCSVDPYLFENFLTEDGDLLRAKFKAFKFPESNFVLFRGVVNVCLDKCQGVNNFSFFDQIYLSSWRQLLLVSQTSLLWCLWSLCNETNQL